MKINCRHPECNKPLKATDWYYCADHEDALNNHLDETINPIIKASQEFYIGRSSYPQKRLLQHFVNYDLDRMAILHWGADWEEIDSLEESLIRDFRKFSKGLNYSDESHGKHSGPWSCIYIAFRLKESPPLNKSFTPVSDLDVSSMLWPVKGCPTPTTYLRTAVNATKAQQILDSSDAKNNKY